MTRPSSEPCSSTTSARWTPSGAHLLEELRGPLPRGHGQRGPDEAAQPASGPGQRGVVHVPGVDEPEHVVDPALEDRVAGLAVRGWQ